MFDPAASTHSITDASRLAISCADPAPLALLRHDHASHSGPAIEQASLGSLDWFTNWGNYVPRIHCMQTADGSPDWPWIIGTVLLVTGVVTGYGRIMTFWIKSYAAEEKRDRNNKLLDLAVIFLLCALCGYFMSILMFVWPAYRLTAVFLALLNFWTWKFALNLKDFKVSFSAKRLQRELAEHLRTRNAELERLVAERTAEAERATALAEAASQTKSAFLANMSHEIRTPMTAILGFADMMAEPAQTEDERRDCIATIRRNGTHLLTIINDILDLSKIEAGRFTIETLPCNPAQIVHETLQLFHAKAEENKVRLHAIGLESLPTCIATDPTRLRQVLINLVGNAVKFTPAGEITVRASFTPGFNDGFTDQPGSISIAVQDTGIGMTPDQQNAIFKPFAQADASATRKFGGTGLGLFISKRLSEMLGGSIACASTFGRGTTMTMTIAAPLAQICDITPSAPASAPPLTAHNLTGRILLAEDGPDNRILIAHHLRKTGAQVDVVEDGHQALIAVDTAARDLHPYSLIVLDMHMPEVDGYAAAKTLRERGIRTPIIALTAASMASDREKCLAAGCDAYLTKPLDVPSLLRTCASLIANAARKVA